MAEQGIPDAIACAGKTARGSGNATTKARHLVSAVIHGTTRVIAQTAVVDEKSNEIPAMHTQRELATYLVEDKHTRTISSLPKAISPRYKRIVERSVARIFPPPVETWDKGHGRLEHRRIRTSTALNAFANFSHLQQVFALERTTTILKTGEVRQAPVVGLCSRRPAELPPEALLDATRLHWTIENQVHGVRDVTWREDQSRVRIGAAPRVLASLRNAVLSWLDLKKKTRIASQRRVFAWDRDAAIALVTEPV